MTSTTSRYEPGGGNEMKNQYGATKVFGTTAMGGMGVPVPKTTIIEMKEGSETDITDFSQLIAAWYGPMGCSQDQAKDVLAKVKQRMTDSNQESWKKFKNFDFLGEEVKSMSAVNLEDVYAECARNGCNAFTVDSGTAWLKRVLPTQKPMPKPRVELYLRSDIAPAFNMKPDTHQSWEMKKNKDFSDLETVTQMVASNLEDVYEQCSYYGCNAFTVFGGTAYLKRVKPTQQPNPSAGMDVYIRRDITAVDTKDAWQKFKNYDFGGEEVKNMVAPAGKLEDVFAECVKLGCNAVTVQDGTAWLKRINPDQKPITKSRAELYIRSDIAPIYGLKPEEHNRWEVLKNYDFENLETVTQMVAPNLEEVYEACQIYGCNAFTMMGGTAYLRRVYPSQSPNPRTGCEVYIRRDIEPVRQAKAWQKLRNRDIQGEDVKNMVAPAGHLEDVYAECIKTGCNAFAVVGSTAWLKRITPSQKPENHLGCELYVRKDMLEVIKEMPDLEDSFEKIKNHDYPDEEQVTTIAVNVKDLDPVYSACQLYGCNAFSILGGTAYLKRVDLTQDMERTPGRDIYIRKDFKPVLNAKAWKKIKDHDFTDRGDVKTMGGGNLEDVYANCIKNGCNAFAIFGGTAYMKRIGPNQRPNKRDCVELYVRRDLVYDDQIDEEDDSWELFKNRDFTDEEDVTMLTTQDLDEVKDACRRYGCNAFTLFGGSAYLKRVALTQKPNSAPGCDVYIRRDTKPVYQKDSWKRFKDVDFYGMDVKNMVAPAGQLEDVMQACALNGCNAFALAGGNAYLKRITPTMKPISKPGAEIYLRNEIAPLFKQLKAERQDNWQKFKNHDFTDEETITQLVAPNIEWVYEQCSIYGCNAFVMLGGTAYLKRVDPSERPNPEAGRDAYMLKDAPIFKIKDSWKKFKDIDYEGREVKNMVANNLEDVYAECAKMGCNAFSVNGDTAWLKRVEPNQNTIPREGCVLHVRKDLARKQPEIDGGDWDVLKNMDFSDLVTVTTVVANNLEEVYEACSIYGCRAFVLFGGTAYLKRVKPTDKPNEKHGCDVYIRTDKPDSNSKKITLTGQKLNNVFGDPFPGKPKALYVQVIKEEMM